MKKLVKVGLEIDKEGKTLVACPYCKYEFKVLFEDLTKQEFKTTCPNCNKELHEVDLPKHLAEKIAIKEAQKYIDEQIKKIFKD